MTGRLRKTSRTVWRPFRRLRRARDFLAALDRVVREAPGGKMRGIFWWESMAGGAIAKRALFDDQHEALPAIHVADPVDFEVPEK